MTTSTEKMLNGAQVGSAVEIRPAFTMDGPLHDEFTGCMGWVLAVSDGYADVQIKNGQEVNFSLRRLKPL